MGLYHYAPSREGSRLGWDCIPALLGGRPIKWQSVVSACNRLLRLDLIVLSQVTSSLFKQIASWARHVQNTMYYITFKVFDCNEV
jgi:hypothetical protein